MQLHIYDNDEEVTTALAEWIAGLMQKTLRTKDKFTIALSGGETPKTLYKKLAAAPFRDKIVWDKIHFFWGDERVVPFTDDRNNAKMAGEYLLSKLTIPANHIHYIRTDIEPVVAANDYEKLLHRYFDDQPFTFDLVLLGMGDDGHTLSLFPNSLVLFQNNNWVNAVYSHGNNTHRITLMPSIVNLAANVAFLITGTTKASALKNVLEGKYQPEKYPAQLIKPVNNELHLFIDDTTAGGLNNAGR